MFEAENIRDWRGLDVVDPDSHKIGVLESIYVDTTNDRPAFAAVQTGMVGRRRLTFVPLEGAQVAPRHLRVTFPRKQVKDAPSIDTDGELVAGDEPTLFEHYGLEYHAGVDGGRRLGRR